MSRPRPHCAMCGELCGGFWAQGRNGALCGKCFMPVEAVA